MKDTDYDADMMLDKLKQMQHTATQRNERT